MSRSLMRWTLLDKLIILCMKKLILYGEKNSFVRSKAVEFSFLVNDIKYDGQNEWSNISLRDTTSVDGGKGVIISFDNSRGNCFFVEIHGDWEPDKKKIPDGLKPVFDYIKSLGMKPGLTRLWRASGRCMGWL